jgi:hypothetical protein
MPADRCRSRMTLLGQTPNRLLYVRSCKGLLILSVYHILLFSALLLMISPERIDVEARVGIISSHEQ